MSDLIGKKFGRLVVVRQVGKDKWGKFKLLCNCDCGNKIIVLGNNLQRGNTKSCGCLQKEIIIKIKTNTIKHGHNRKGRRTRTYKSRVSMKQRCTNSNHKYYNLYGGREITVCKRWLKFENFLEDMGECPLGCTIDRIDNDKGYYKGNCKWSTAREQSRHKRNSLYVTYNGISQLLIELSEKIKIPYKILYNRIYNYGWSIEKALIIPIRRKNKI